MQTMPARNEEGAEAIVCHPFEPFLPPNALLLMLGTFPPAKKRWSIPWYYPNFQNDMWRIFGLIYFGDKNHFVDLGQKTYRMDLLKDFLKARGVAIFDTALRVRRTKNTASDKDLEIVEPSDLDGLLEALPQCMAVLTAGRLATHVFSEHYGIKMTSPMGGWADFSFKGRPLRLYRMPSSSRAYPMPLEQKAAFYEKMFRETGLL